MLFHIGYIAALVALERRKPKLAITDEVRWCGHAWPWHCDANLHVNNAQFARLMEYGRWAWIVRTGIWSRVRAARGNFLVAGSSQVFRREVRLLQRFEVRTRLNGLDERSAIFEQSIWTAGGRLACHSYQRVMVVGSGGIQRPDALVDGIALPIADAALLSWLNSQADILAREKAGSLGASSAAENDPLTARKVAPEVDSGSPSVSAENALRGSGAAQP